MRRNHPTPGLVTDPTINHIVGPAETISGRPGLRVDLVDEDTYSRTPDALWVETPQGDKIAQVIGYTDDGFIVVSEPGDIDLREHANSRG